MKKATFLLGLLFFIAVLGKRAQAAKALQMTPQNTVIVDGSTYAGTNLQYYLVKFYVGDKEAQQYTDAKSDRSVSPYFPIVKNGAEIPVDKNIIAVGQTKYLSATDRARLGAAPYGASSIKREGNVVVIAGSPFDNPWLGDYTAMSDFLNHVCGIRFYAPDDLWISHPKSAFISVGDIDFFQRQAFESTFLAPYYPRNAEWARMNSTASRLSVSVSWNLVNVFPPDKYGKTHPDIYEMCDGKRVIPAPKSTSWNPSFVAPELPDLTMDYIRERRKQNPRLKYISLGAVNEFHDETPAAQELVKKYGGYTNLYYAYVNEVARRANKEFPGLLITTYSFSGTPKNMKIEPNVAVGFVAKLYNTIDHQWLKAEKQNIQKMSDLGAKWFIHDWNFAGVSPRIYSAQYADFLKWGKAHGMLGDYMEYSPGESWYLDGAKYWISTQILANPDQDTNALWKTYCDDMYGAGADDMYQLFTHFQDKYARAMEYITPADLPRQAPALYSPQDLALERGLIESAIAKTKDNADIQKRLASVMRYFRGHELFAQASYQPNYLDTHWKGEGVNKALLAFYLNDDGSKLDQAIRYYDNDRTVPPDAHKIADSLGLRNSYINNYTRGFAGVLRQIRLASTKQNENNNVAQLDAKANEILRTDLPQKYLPDQVHKSEAILDKPFVVPTVAQMPTIDGDLSDAVWQQAATLSDWTERDTLLIPKDTTSGKIIRVGDNLVIGLQAKHIGPIWAKSPKDSQTGSLWRESGFEIFFGPPAKAGEDSAPFAQYIVNALGSFRGFQKAEGNRAGVDAAVKLYREAGTYTVEIAVPLKGAKYDYTQEKELTFNIARNVYTSDSYQQDVQIGWYPIFATSYNLDSRGVIFLKP